MTTHGLRESELAGAFVVRDPDWRQKIFFGGLLLLLLHPIGWPAVLGYRKTLILNLASGAEPLLPEWKGRVTYFFFEGIKAMGVIFGYLSPLYLILLFLLLSNGVQPNVYWFYVGIFYLAFTIFSTLSFPSILIYWTFFSEGYRVPVEISLILLAAFGFIIFFIPAGFLQVSRTGRYLSAFNVAAAFSTLTTHLRAYLLAWYHSALLSLSGHFALPFAPWGVVWCYLGIIFEFNSILQKGHEEKGAVSWFQRLHGADELRLQSTRYSLIFQCVNPADSDICLMLRLGPILIPLPTIIVKCLSKEGL
ncbi:MAG: DUF4013 domain-containing protein [Deltaproteobacteria bacterium]|nr:DUF4013 domain-containing protein [Deltaproteobacteria bacterium]